MRLELPIKLHVKKWLTGAMLGPEPVTVRKNTIIGRVVCAVMSNGAESFSIEDEQPAETTKTIEVRMDDNKTIVIKKNSGAGAQIARIIEQSTKPKNFEEIEASESTLKCDFLFEIEEYKITPERLKIIADLLEDHFNTAVTFFAFGRMDVIPVVNAAVVNFYRDYQISDEELKKDTVCKMILRRRQSEIISQKTKVSLNK